MKLNASSQPLRQQQAAYIPLKTCLDSDHGKVESKQLAVGANIRRVLLTSIILVAVIVVCVETSSHVVRPIGNAVEHLRLPAPLYSNEPSMALNQTLTDLNWQHIHTKSLQINPRKREYETPVLSTDLIRAVHANPCMLQLQPSLLKAFEATPWLLPSRYHGLDYAQLKNKDLVKVAALRSKPKGQYDRTITVAFFSRGMIRMLQNCIYSMVKFGGVDNYIVATWSDEDLNACLDLNLPCADAHAYLPADPDEASHQAENSTAAAVPVEGSIENSTPSTRSSTAPAVPEFETKAYNRIMWLKPAVVKALLELGYAVHSTDIDLAYAAKPVWESYLNYLHLGSEGAAVADAAFQTEGKPDSSTSSPINSGNFVALPTPAAKALFSAWVGLASEKVNQGGNQKGLLKLFKERVFKLCQEQAECDQVLHSRDEGRQSDDSASATFQDLPSDRVMRTYVDAAELPLLQPNMTLNPLFSSILSPLPAIIRAYNPPWWSITQNYCALSGEGPPPAMDLCSPALMYLHPICTPKGDRLEVKIDVLKQAGFWFLEEEGCPIGDEALAALSDTKHSSTGPAVNEDIYKDLQSSDIVVKGIERCLPAEVRQPGREAAVAKCGPQLAFV